MIQEKDFLYRVPVKTQPITTPGGQIRNPEILVDVEGGEFMHGNILDANSTNKLINQSVKDAVDNKLDGLHTALNQAITEKADASALANEVSRATGAESGLQAAIATKADATALSNYVLTTALNKQVDTLNAAISAKQDAGSYISYDQTVTSRYKIDKDLMIDNSEGSAVLGTYSISAISNSNTEIQINPSGITMRDDDDVILLSRSGITLPDGDNDHVLTSYGSTINIGEYATQSDLSAQLGPKADRSDLLTLEKKVTANTTALKGKQDKGDYVRYSTQDDDGYFFHDRFTSSKPFVVDDSDGNDTEYGINGIVASKYQNCLATSDGTFKPISDFASAEDVSSLSVGLSKKQNKITVNEVDVTDIETADITKLRTIVTNLINALSESGLIRETETLE